MPQKKTALDVLYESCKPFDESETAKTQVYRRLAVRIAEMDLELARCAEAAGVDFDQYQNCTAYDFECERRHYFAEGFRLGCEAGRGEIHSLLEDMRDPGNLIF